MIIQLTQGMSTEIGDEDLPLIQGISWHAYEQNSIWYAKDPYGLKMHRHILGITDPEILVDHKDGNGLNNKRANLRRCNLSQNQWNRTKRKGASRFKGVFAQSKGAGTWMAAIKCHGVRKYLGTHKTEIGAALAYDKAARELFGEFARPNFEFTK